MSKINRIKLYLHDNDRQSYVNTEEEQELLNAFSHLYTVAKGAQEQHEEAKPENLQKWRKAYLGTLGALNRDGTESKRKGRQLRKMVYEIIESKVDNSVPMPKMSPRYKSDLHLVNVTEDYLKYEVDRALTKYDNDRSERSTYIDGTGWYKVSWNSLDNTHERSGNIQLDFCTVDQVIPQPGIRNYKDLEYIFERRRLSTSRIWDLYHRNIEPLADDNLVEVVSCYYLNDDRIVGLFMWSLHSGQVITNDECWQIRKLRTCTRCGEVNPKGKECGLCGSSSFRFTNATAEILDTDLEMIYNPYDVGETNDDDERDRYTSKVFLKQGSEIPFYQVNQLPFVPRPAVSSIDSIYGISDVMIELDMQDAANKVLTKAVDKTLKSGAVVTKPEKIKLDDKDETFKVIGVRSAEEAQMVSTKQIVADTSQDILIAGILYDSGKASSGITDSFQGQKDTTATSGKAKQYAAMQSAGRIQSLREMKSAAFAGVYELVFKYLLAFSDEERRFIKTLPNGSEQEECWNKYMFLDKDKYGQVYYRDDFKFDCDTASTLSQNRVQMWQETQDKFIQGAFGNPADPRTLETFWNTMNALQYPLAKVALAAIKENEKHLPFEVEQALMQNPELLQIIMTAMQGGKQGGARPNSGPVGNGATHSANVERTNERNRAGNREVIANAQMGGL